MDKLESENFAAIANSRLARCFIAVDGQALRPDSVFFVLGSADWTPDYQHMLGTNGLPDGTPAMYRMNLRERLAFGTDGSAISLRGRALNLNEPVVRKTQDNGEGYNYTDSKRMARMIWETWYGKIPAGMEIDHMNRKRNDDRLSNLRLVTHSQNSRNRKPAEPHSWLASDRVLLIPVRSGNPVFVHPSDAYEIVRDCNTWKTDIYFPATFGYIMPLCSDSDGLDGLNSHLVIVDELHAIKDANLYEVLKQSISARDQPIICMITTAGTVRESMRM